MDQIDEIPLFSIIFKSGANLDNEKEGDTDLQVTENSNLEEVLSADSSCTNKTENSDKNIFPSDDSNSQDVTEEFRPHPHTTNQLKDQSIADYLSLLTHSKESENEYETEEVSSDDLSFDEEILGASNLVSTTRDFEVYSVPLSSACDILEKTTNIPSKKVSNILQLKSYRTVSEYKRKLRSVKLRRAKYRKKIRMLEDECDELQQKLDSLKTVLNAASNKNMPKASNSGTLDYFDMDSDDNA